MDDSLPPTHTQTHSENAAVLETCLAEVAALHGDLVAGSEREGLLVRVQRFPANLTTEETIMKLHGHDSKDDEKDGGEGDNIGSGDRDDVNNHDDDDEEDNWLLQQRQHWCSLWC